MDVALCLNEVFIYIYFFMQYGKNFLTLRIAFSGYYNLDDPPPHPFDEALVPVLVTLLPSIVEVEWSGSLQWLRLLINRILLRDRNHSIAQQCIALIQQIAAEISNRVNPYHLLLATR